MTIGGCEPKTMSRPQCTMKLLTRRDIRGIWKNGRQFLARRLSASPKKNPRDAANNRLIGQLVGAATSVGANYREANESVSKKDFTHSISRCMKESKETKFFLRMVVAAEPQLADEARPLYRGSV